MKREEKPASSKLRRFLYHPIYGPLGLFVTFTLFFVGLYNIPSRELRFSIYPARMTILKLQQTSLLDVYYKKEKIDSDVTAIQIGMWNSGKHEINNEDILEPITIYTEPTIPILEASIKKTSRELVNLSLDKSTLEKGSLAVTWKILEKGDGGLIQIIYAGDTTVLFKVKGTIKGQGPPRIKSPMVPSREKVSLGTILLGALGILSVIFGSAWLGPKDVPPRMPGPMRFAFLFALIFLILGSLYVLIVSSRVPPFGFY